MRIGTTFPAELTAAGIPLDGIIWEAASGVITVAPEALSDRIAEVLAAHDPTRVATPPTVSGNQWAFAIGNLGLATAWRAGIGKSKDKDQIRWSLIARDTPLLATDPLLIRIAGNAGTDANGAALIDVPTVFRKAQTEAT